MQSSADESGSAQSCTSEERSTPRKNRVVEPDALWLPSILSSVIDENVTEENAKTSETAEAIRRRYKREMLGVIAEWAADKQRELRS